MNKFLPSTVTVTVLLAIWWYLATQTSKAKFIASPTDVMEIYLSNKFLELMQPTIVTLYVLALCLTASLVIGYFLGCGMGFSAIANAFFMPLVTALKSVPVTVFVPLFLTVFGLDLFVYPMVILPVLAMVAFNVSQAIHEIPSEREHQRKMLGISYWLYIKDIVFWETLEAVFATLRIAVPFSLTLQIALDYFMSTSRGLGHTIRYENDAYNYAEAYAAIGIVCLIGYCSLVIVGRISEHMLRWKVQTLS